MTTSGSKSQLITSGGFSQQIKNPNNFASSALASYASSVQALAKAISFGTLSYTFWVPQSAFLLRVSAQLLTAFDAGATLEIGSSNPLATPAAPTVTAVGTSGATTYGYKVVALNSDTTHSIASAANAAFTTGNATLSVTNLNRVAFVAVAGAESYGIYRTVGGATQGLIGTTTSLSFDDTGLVADGSTAPTTATAGQDVMTPKVLTAGGEYGSVLTPSLSAVQNAAGQPEGVQQLVMTITGSPTVGAAVVFLEYINTLPVPLQN